MSSLKSELNSFAYITALYNCANSNKNFPKFLGATVRGENYDTYISNATKISYVQV